MGNIFLGDMYGKGGTLIQNISYGPTLRSMNDFSEGSMSDCRRGFLRFYQQK